MTSTLTALYLWTVVASVGTTYTSLREYDWRWSGQFATPAACERAAAQLALKPGRFRCVPLS